MRGAEEDIKAAGAQLVVIGNGTPGFAQGFRDELGFTGLLLTDPSLRAYQLAGMERGLKSVNPRALLEAVRAFGKGFRQTSTRGDAWQLGGVIVVRPPGELVYRYASQHAGDHPDNASILGALRTPR